MNIGAILPESLLDYPGKVSAVFFTIGCNFRCPFCYNVSLALGKEKSLSNKKIESFLEERKNFLDAIILTGGEVTLQKDLVPFAKKIKENSYLLGIETNGSRPNVIKELLDLNLVDFIAMDVKADLENYSKASGVKLDTSKIKKSIELIKNSKVDYEFRTTVIPEIHSSKMIENIGKVLRSSEKLVLQQFVNKETMIDSSFKKIEPYTRKELERFKKILEKYISKVEIRTS